MERRSTPPAAEAGADVHDLGMDALRELDGSFEYLPVAILHTTMVSQSVTPLGQAVSAFMIRL